MLHFCDFGAIDPPSPPPSGSGLFACLPLELSETLKSELSERGLKPTEGNFVLARTIKKAAYMQLSDAEKARHGMEAAEYNEKIKRPPTISSSKYQVTHYHACH
jgi:hypothetical protein